MTPPYAVLVGLDWADQRHDICWQDVATGRVHTLVVEQRPERINQWICELSAKYPGQRLAIALEQTRGAVVYALMGYPQVDLYPVNPATLSQYRKAFHPSGAKDDPTDASLLLDLLVRHREALKRWQPDTEETRLLRSLSLDRRKLVDERSALCNSLRAKLKEYFPQALELVGEELFREMSCAFLMKWPQWKAIAAAPAETLRRFYYTQQCRSEDLIQQRLDLIASSRALTTDEAVIEAGMSWVAAMVRQIRALNRSIHRYEKRIAELFDEHADASIFRSFPGAGANLAPRLLATYGTDRTRYRSAVEVNTAIGVAPVMERSGNQTWIHWRWHCPTFERQSVVEFAGQSVRHSQWAGIYYHEQIRRGKDHDAALRALGFKWNRILFRCWQNRVAYDESKYLAALERHGSWIAARLKKTA